MLVFSRKVDEVIRIGDDIEIMIVQIRGNKARIGIKAPKESRVVRAEIKESEESPNVGLPFLCSACGQETAVMVLRCQKCGRFSVVRKQEATQP